MMATRTWALSIAIAALASGVMLLPPAPHQGPPPGYHAPPPATPRFETWGLGNVAASSATPHFVEASSDLARLAASLTAYAQRLPPCEEKLSQDPAQELQSAFMRCAAEATRQAQAQVRGLDLASLRETFGHLVLLDEQNFTRTALALDRHADATNPVDAEVLSAVMDRLMLYRFFLDRDIGAAEAKFQAGIAPTVQYQELAWVFVGLQNLQGMLDAYAWAPASPCRASATEYANQVAARLDELRSRATTWGNATEGAWHGSMLGDLNVIVPPRLEMYRVHSWWPGLAQLDQDLDLYHAYWHHFSDAALPTRDEAAHLVRAHDASKTLSSEHMMQSIRVAVNQTDEWKSHAQQALETKVLDQMEWRFGELANRCDGGG